MLPCVLVMSVVVMLLLPCVLVMSVGGDAVVPTVPLVLCSTVPSVGTYESNKSGENPTTIR